MQRADLEHLIRAAAVIADADDIVIVGSQSILGSFPSAPAELLRFAEADLFPRRDPSLAIVIDGAIGEGSPFHETFGYYAHGVGPETSVVGLGWEARLVPIKNANTRGATGWCLEPHDAVAAKLAAGREHHIEFAAAALAAGLVSEAVLRERIAALEVEAARREHADLMLSVAVARCAESKPKGACGRSGCERSC